MKSLKQKLSDCELTIGSWLTIGNTATTEIMAKAGFDWLTIDLEHSAITLSEAQKLLQVIELSGVTPLVRVGSNDPVIIKRVMDAGAHGIIIPMVNTQEDAVAAVEFAYYPPKGKRGVGLARAQNYGLGFKAYKKWLDEECVVIVLIEHIEAIENLEAILSVEGIDGSIIGPYDLSASLGFPGEYDRPEVQNAINVYRETCKRLGKPAGFHVVPSEAEMLKEKEKEGYSFLGFSLDSLFLGNKIKEQLDMVK
ncbi:MAG: 2,4-dihydroxyhept-2-ene-1,7-dioic acid aldolase [Candidatus Omnitrophica bacterium]|nr:2,4-dihydroxyhept-2-ene-1,7-dioic acid aldolase [Candidatus Omnitrophota bacterium]MBU1997538.1 2,4-dihydroxyhept-2-ene-1,7-dioic acid aldolase [Candidatus Omnitrophota bacterium]MBU4334748.1 2,4-dihydroxyhept-2-ene-1,7-dioic acid aldolase [Candidatus Omnitrophota bacterium]